MADNSGLTPHTDPFNQTIEKIDVNSVPHWKVTNYDFGELNDGSAQWQTKFLEFFKSQIDVINEKLSKAASEFTNEEQQELQVYLQTISTYTNFPIGFTLPEIPKSFNKLVNLVIIPPKPSAK